MTGRGVGASERRETERCRNRGKRRLGCGGETRLAVPRQVAERFSEGGWLLGCLSALLHRPVRSAFARVVRRRVAGHISTAGKAARPLVRWSNALPVPLSSWP